MQNHSIYAVVGLVFVLAFAILACNENDDYQADDDANDDDVTDDDATDDDVSPDDDTTDDDQVDDDAHDDDVTDDDATDDDTADDDTVPPTPDYDTDFDGYGRNATGGVGGDVQTVTTLADDGPGSLRQILADATGPLTVLFDVDGTIVSEHVIALPSDLTIDARGRNITITQNGFIIDGRENIILMNLAFQDVSGDIGDSIAIGNASHDIVIFHCAFDNEGLMPFVPNIPDEQISIVWGSTDITISWCRFANHDKVLLIGNGDAPQSVDENIRVTAHHNYFYHTGRRHPYLRFGKVDFYNNVLWNWQFYIDKTYGSRSRENAQLLLEKNWYEQDNPLYMLGAYYQLGGKIKLIDNYTSNDWIVMQENKPDEVFARPYEADVHALGDVFLTMMENHTGNTMPNP